MDDPARPPGWSPGDPLPAATFAGLPLSSAPVSLCAPPLRTAPTLGDLAGAATKEQEQRADDLFLLRAIVKHLADETAAHEEATEPPPDPPEEGEAGEEEDRGCELAADELLAFSAMLVDLEQERREVLTKKQREWAIGAAERREVEWGDHGARNRAVPKGAHVELLVDTMRRPLAPPGRKPTELPGRKTA